MIDISIVDDDCPNFMIHALPLSPSLEHTLLCGRPTRVNFQFHLKFSFLTLLQLETPFLIMMRAYLDNN